MRATRLLVHPVLGHPRSRMIFVWFAVANLAATAVLWISFRTVIASIGLHPALLLNAQSGPLQFLLSPYWQVGIVLSSTVATSAFTAARVVGPARRIEEWLNDWENGQKISPLFARSGDHYAQLIQLINDFHERALRVGKKSPPEKG